MRKNLWIDEKKKRSNRSFLIFTFYYAWNFVEKKEHQMKHKERSLNIFMAHKRSR